MTDKEKWKEFLSEFGIEFEDRKDELYMEEGFKRVGGYKGFIFAVIFNDDDSFQKIGVWE